MDVYISRQSFREVARGFSQRRCILSGAKDVTALACCSSSTHMNMPSIPGDTCWPAAASFRRLVFHCMNVSQFSNSCPGEGSEPGQMYFEPSSFLLNCSGSATAATMPFPDSLTARAYALPVHHYDLLDMADGTSYPEIQHQLSESWGGISEEFGSQTTWQ